MKTIYVVIDGLTVKDDGKNVINLSERLIATIKNNISDGALNLYGAYPGNLFSTKDAAIAFAQKVQDPVNWIIFQTTLPDTFEIEAANTNDPNYEGAKDIVIHSYPKDFCENITVFSAETKDLKFMLVNNTFHLESEAQQIFVKMFSQTVTLKVHPETTLKELRKIFYRKVMLSAKVLGKKDELLIFSPLMKQFFSLPKDSKGRISSSPHTFSKACFQCGGNYLYEEDQTLSQFNIKENHTISFWQSIKTPNPFFPYIPTRVDAKKELRDLIKMDRKSILFSPSVGEYVDILKSIIPDLDLFLARILNEAITSSDRGTVRLMCDTFNVDPNRNYPGDIGVPFILACKQADHSTISELLYEGANPNIMELKDETMTPVQHLFLRGMYLAMVQLIKHGANMFMKNGQGLNLLELAFDEAYQAPSEVIETLKLLSRCDGVLTSWIEKFTRTIKDPIQLVHHLNALGPDADRPQCQLDYTIPRKDLLEKFPALQQELFAIYKKGEDVRATHDGSGCSIGAVNEYANAKLSAVTDRIYTNDSTKFIARSTWEITYNPWNRWDTTIQAIGPSFAPYLPVNRVLFYKKEICLRLGQRYVQHESVKSNLLSLRNSYIRGGFIAVNVYAGGFNQCLSYLPTQCQLTVKYIFKIRDMIKTYDASEYETEGELDKDKLNAAIHSTFPEINLALLSRSAAKAIVGYIQKAALLIRADTFPYFLLPLSDILSQYQQQVPSLAQLCVRSMLTNNVFSEKAYRENLEESNVPGRKTRELINSAIALSRSENANLDYTDTNECEINFTAPI